MLYTLLAERAAGELRVASVGDADLQTAVSLGESAIVSVVITLVVGGLLVAVAPRYARVVVQSVRDTPGSSLINGIPLVLLGLLVYFLLAISIVFSPLVLPLTIAFVPLFALGFTVGVMGLLARVADDQFMQVVGAAAVSGLVSLVPPVSLLTGIVFGVIGLGAMGEQYVD